MEFKSLDTTKKIAEIHLFHPGTGALLYSNDDKGKPDKKRPVLIRLYSPDSDKAKHVQADVARKRQSGRNRNVTVTPELLKELELELMAGLTHSWSEIEHDGKTLECPKDVIFFYESYPWAMEQVKAANEDRANFLERA